MVFWVAVSLISIAIPLSMIIIGILFIRAAFVGFSSNIGYRSHRSRRSREEWAFANKSIGRSLIVFGSILLPIYSIIMLVLFNSNESTVGLFGGILILVSLIPVLLSVLPVERKLRKNFDIFGKRKPKE